MTDAAPFPMLASIALLQLVEPLFRTLSLIDALLPAVHASAVPAERQLANPFGPKRTKLQSGSKRL